MYVICTYIDKHTCSCYMFYKWCYNHDDDRVAMSAYTKLYVNSCNDTVVMMSFLTFFHYSPRLKKSKNKIELFNDQPQPQTIIGLDLSGPASVHIHWFTTFPLLLNNFPIRYVCLREWAMCGASVFFVNCSFIFFFL